MVAINLRLKPEFHQLHPSSVAPGKQDVAGRSGGLWVPRRRARGVGERASRPGVPCGVRGSLAAYARAGRATLNPARLAECSDNGPFYRYTPGVIEQSSPIVLGLVILDGKRILIDSGFDARLVPWRPRR